MSFYNTALVSVWKCAFTRCYYVCLQMEIDSGDELTEEFLYDEVHPKQQAFKQAFAKPRGPAGKRGNKRLIKGPATRESRPES